MTQKPTDALRRFAPKLNKTGLVWLSAMLVAGLGVIVVTWLVLAVTDERLNNQLSSSTQSAENALIALESQQSAQLRDIITRDNLAMAIIEGDTDSLHEIVVPLVTSNQIETLIFYNSGAEVVYSLGYDRVDATLERNPIRAGFLLDGVFRALADDFTAPTFADFSPNSMFYLTMPVLLDDSNMIAGAVSIGMKSTQIVDYLAEQSLADVTLYAASGRFIGSSFVDASPVDFALTTDSTNGRYRSRYSRLDFHNIEIGILGVALPTNVNLGRMSLSRSGLMLLFGGVFFAVSGIGLVLPRLLSAPVAPIAENVHDNNEEALDDLRHEVETLTERNQEIEKLYEQQVAATIERDAVFASIADAAFVRGADGEFMMVNPAARDLITAVRDDETAYRVFYYLQEKPERITEPRIVTLLDKHYRVLANPVIQQNQASDKYIMVFHDVTRMVEAERTKDEMLLHFSRELRKSLINAHGHHPDLAKFNHETSASLDRTLGYLQTIDRMVLEVMDASALLANEVSLAVEPIPLIATIRRIIENQCPQIEAKNLQIGCNFPDDEMLLQADVTQIEKAIGHLLHNAISYTPDNGWIEITLDKNADSVDLFIVDNGAGIADDEVDDVFERMVRGQSASTTMGLGLGLYISREIIHAHSGSIRLQSTVNTGTMVTVTLPIQ